MVFLALSGPKFCPNSTTGVARKLELLNYKSWFLHKYIRYYGHFDANSELKSIKKTFEVILGHLESSSSFYLIDSGSRDLL